VRGGEWIIGPTERIVDPAGDAGDAEGEEVDGDEGGDEEPPPDEYEVLSSCMGIALIASVQTDPI
jgi:hypothetical protein